MYHHVSLRTKSKTRGGREEENDSKKALLSLLPGFNSPKENPQEFIGGGAEFMQRFSLWQVLDTPPERPLRTDVFLGRAFSFVQGEGGNVKILKSQDWYNLN